MKTISIEALETVSGGTAREFRRYVGGGRAVNLLEGGKALITTITGAQHQISIAPKGTHRF